MMPAVSRSVRVTIAGQELAIRTDARPRYLKDLAAYVTARMEQAGAGGKVVSTQKLAALAAMSLADELFQLRDAHDRLVREVRERSRRILATLDSEASA
jgi:cell division protein ZapA